MRAYSIDFRLTVIHAHERGQGSQRQLAELFDVRLSFIQAPLHTKMHFKKDYAGRENPSASGHARHLYSVLGCWPTAC
jgi:hypothetical protein